MKQVIVQNIYKEISELTDTDINIDNKMYTIQLFISENSVLELKNEHTINGNDIYDYIFGKTGIYKHITEGVIDISRNVDTKYTSIKFIGKGIIFYIYK